LRFFKMLNLPAVAFGADIHPVRDHPGIDGERRKTFAAKIGKAFLASHQACGGFLAFYTNGCGFLFHGFPS
ncbi:MAG TPA: hypothetical protein VGA28_06705, partial [Desulfurivibrionaceae bacterium]